MEPPWISSNVVELIVLFCPCPLIWHKKFLSFSEIRSKLAKINFPKKRFWTISTTKNSRKKTLWILRKNNPLQKKLEQELKSLCLPLTIVFIFNAGFLSTIPCYKDLRQQFWFIHSHFLTKIIYLHEKIRLGSVWQIYHLMYSLDGPWN